MVGVPKTVNTVGPFLLGDFVFDADGGFTTVQDFDGELPIGVGFTPGLALAAGSSSGTSFGVRLRATQVAEPPLLGLLALALLGLAAASLLEAAARGRRG
jgi:hypothetical protein